MLLFFWGVIFLGVCVGGGGCVFSCCFLLLLGARSSSVVERPHMVRRVLVSIPHGHFSFQPVLHDWWKKGRGMCYTLFV